MIPTSIVDDERVSTHTPLYYLVVQRYTKAKTIILGRVYKRSEEGQPQNMVVYVIVSSQETRSNFRTDVVVRVEYLGIITRNMIWKS